MASDFYLVLPSNSSMHLHPNNTLTNYVTMLPRRISLSAEWECGLVEINYPHNWFNVREKDGVFTIQPETGRLDEYGVSRDCYRTFIDASYYDNPDTLFRAINKKLIMSPKSKKNRVKLSYSNISQKATVHLSPNTKLTMTEDMGHMLGFPSAVLSSPTRTYSFKPFELRSVVDLNQGLESLYVYSSVVEPRIVGNSVVPLLRIVPITGKQGQVVSTHFDNVHYLPLLGKEFGNVEIDIRDDTGRPVPFERGKVTVTLHFRRRKNGLF